ncbi:GNAT family N-acetyltransferase [Holospora undulata]|uniref:Putative acetyltransferase n=1 Tax=Holospora undulata HU1 TaxID=1321371 RepID=A0A061JGA8_9PROT|nr:GNAT family N-acetyltransferase [Holospora undulata]ETZ04950.1 putative acetyltransferase [Holospora undulata HU1]
MIKIELLKNHPSTIPALAHIWHEVLGKIWVPDVPVERVITRFADHLKIHALPITFIALDGDLPVGMCSLRENDGIRPDLTPWLGSLVVDPKYQKQGIGKMLIDVTVLKAKELGFEKLYLFAFDDPTIPEYCERLGWREIGMDEFKSHPVIVMEALYDQNRPSEKSSRCYTSACSSVA